MEKINVGAHDHEQWMATLMAKSNYQYYCYSTKLISVRPVHSAMSMAPRWNYFGRCTVPVFGEKIKWWIKKWKKTQTNKDIIISRYQDATSQAISRLQVWSDWQTQEAKRSFLSNEINEITRCDPSMLLPFLYSMVCSRKGEFKYQNKFHLCFHVSKQLYAVKCLSVENVTRRSLA